MGKKGWKIRLLVIEDNRLLREGISTMLLEHTDIKVVAALGTGENLLQKIRKYTPDVLLLDLGLRSQNSLHLVESVKRKFPATKMIVMDLVPVQEDIFIFVRAGVSGFVLKDATTQDFLNTIRAVAQGTKVLPPHLTSSLFSQIVDDAINGSSKRPSGLMESIRMTKREREVIHLVADGLTNKEIAQKLHLSTYTIKSHVHNILDKLALHTRVQIAKYAHTSRDFRLAMNSISLVDE
jgi:DNA-binding NarL/FixJ family response regulator